MDTTKIVLLACITAPFIAILILVLTAVLVAQ